MNAHEEARLRAVPMVTRIVRRVAEHLGCEVEHIVDTPLATDLESIVLEEIGELLDPWQGDRHTPLIPEMQGDHAEEPVTVNERVPDEARKVPREKRTKKITPR